MSTLDDIAAGAAGLDADDIAKRLDEEQSKEFAPAFRFDGPGDTVAGRVTAVDSRTTDYGTYPIVTLLQKDGEEAAIHGFGTVLKDKLETVEVGQAIAVRFEGLSTSKGGREFKNFTVAVL